MGILNQENKSKGLIKEEVVKELKEILKNLKPICIGVPYDTTNEETNNFIEMNPERNKIYFVEGVNPYADSYDLEDDGVEISLSRLKEIIDKVAELTLEKNIENQELMNWLNE